MDPQHVQCNGTGNNNEPITSFPLSEEGLASLSSEQIFVIISHLCNKNKQLQDALKKNTDACKKISSKFIKLKNKHDSQHRVDSPKPDSVTASFRSGPSNCQQQYSDIDEMSVLKSHNTSLISEAQELREDKLRCEKELEESRREISDVQRDLARIHKNNQILSESLKLKEDELNLRNQEMLNIISEKRNLDLRLNELMNEYHTLTDNYDMLNREQAPTNNSELLINIATMKENEERSKREYDVLNSKFQTLQLEYQVEKRAKETLLGERKLTENEILELRKKVNTLQSKQPDKSLPYNEVEKVSIVQFATETSQVKPNMSSNSTLSSTAVGNSSFNNTQSSKSGPASATAFVKEFICPICDCHLPSQAVLQIHASSCGNIT